MLPTTARLRQQTVEFSTQNVIALLICFSLWGYSLIPTPLCAFFRLQRLRETIWSRSRLNARLPAAHAEFLQRVRRLLTGGSLCPACALGGNRLAKLFQNNRCINAGWIDQFLLQPLY